jgi:hypothetical protein
MANASVPFPFCWICKQELLLEDSKTDEHGKSVHEACYVTRMQMEHESSRPKANGYFDTDA